MTIDETIQHLNQLTETCKDGELGYRTASEHVRNTELETIFAGYAKQRGEFARQLQAEVVRLGGQSTDSSTLTGAMFRGWMNLKSSLTGGDGAAIIAACETGEENAVGAYELVASLDISGQTRSLIENQRHKIKEAHARILRLKEETSHADYQKNEDARQG